VMPIFAYRGLATDQRSTSGSVSADSPRQARDELRSRGIQVEWLAPQAEAASWSIFSFWRYRNAQSQWTLASNELSMLLRAGIPLVEALDTLAQQYRGQFRTSLIQIRDRVTNGESLADALASEPNVFDPATVRLVEVGENGGTLDSVLEQLSSYRRRIAMLGDKVLTSLLYPFFLVVFGLFSAIFLMTYVLPPLLENLSETVTQLPWPTRVASALSYLLVNYGLAMLIGLIVLIFAGWSLLQIPSIRLQYDRRLLRVPIIGELLIKQSMSRITTIVGMLSRSGLPLPNAVLLAAKSVRNRWIADAMHGVHQSMVEGKDISMLLKSYGVFPPMAVRVFSIGTESGNLDEMLLALGDEYNRQVDVQAARLTALLEPALIIVIAFFVGFLLVATLLPILQASNLQGV
jgi:general secretion pathway protein F